MSVVTSIAAVKSSDRRWWVLAIVVVAQFMFVVDAFVVNVAIPSIRADLHATTGEIQGVIVLYQIAFATLIITGGRLGDIRGSKPVFLLGLLGFTLASLWCGLARSGGELVTARAVQGAAAALMIPQVLATIHLLFRDAERGRAFGIYGFTLGFGGAVGFGLGGWLVALDLGNLGWRTIFFVNAPIGLALMGAALRLIPSIPTKPGARLDLMGAIVLLVALLCLIGPLLLGADLGWSPSLFAVVAAGLGLLALMWPLERWVEHHRKGLPLVHLALLQDSSFTTSLLAVFFFTFANISFYLVITLYMQLGLHFSPLQSGSVVLPLAIGFAVMSRLAGPRAQRRGVAALLEGCGIQIVGLAILDGAAAIGRLSAPSALALLLVVFGVGQAMVMAPLYGLVLTRVPAAHAGSGGGVMITVQQIGNAAGVAVIGTLYYSIQAAHSARYALLASLGCLAISIGLSAGLLCVLDRAPSEVRSALREWRRRKISRAVLASFNERMLRDIGLTRAEADQEVTKPFWRI
jgi:EmrB/QacA subfamily drug resistance transporter